MPNRSNVTGSSKCVVNDEGVPGFARSLPTRATAMQGLLPSFRTSEDSSVLRTIQETGINVAIWERSLPPVLGRTLSSWVTTASAAFDAMLDSERYDLSPVLKGIEDPARAWLLGDMALLIGHFLSLADESRFRLFFGAVRGDQCRKFHVDNVRLRLVVTYLGPGTEWLPNDAVNRAALGMQSATIHEANHRMVPDPEKIRHARAGDVVLLKGALDNSVGQKAAVHRSPPIERTGGTRVVLVVTAGTKD